MKNELIIEKLNDIRNGYVNAFNFFLLDLPESAKNEEIAATRTANRLILELENEIKIEKHRNKNKK